MGKHDAVLPALSSLQEWTPRDTLAALPLVNADAHRGGMRHVAAAVTVITAGVGDTRAGFTATAVCSVTAEPPRLVVFANKNVYASTTILTQGALCVNVLAAHQEELARAFAGMLPGVQGEARFRYGQWDGGLSGAPVLAGAKASFDCRVVKVFDESTHYAFLCEVLATREDSAGDALLYMGGRFRRLADD
ncbi:flavin reductase [Kerstersia similis]|uniref:flavin reductase n=1 Tax=Kerstersia similis TaxID=206505 RepID=UPI0039F13E7E